MECVVITAQELSMRWASVFSFRSFSSRYLAHRFNLTHSTNGFRGFYAQQYMILFVSALSYRICSVICSPVCRRIEAAASITLRSLSSSLSTSSCVLSGGRCFILHNHNTERSRSCCCYLEVLQSREEPVDGNDGKFSTFRGDLNEFSF